MNIVCIVKKGKNLAHTLSSIKFNEFGESLNIPFLVCDTWEDGFKQAAGFQYGLFIDAGTVFYDLPKFIEMLKNYPHQGFIGHIVDTKNPDEYFYIDPQCFFLTLSLFVESDFTEAIDRPLYVPDRSLDNIHDDYTPLWVKKSKQIRTYAVHKFGSQLIAKMFDLNKIVVNFKQSLRQYKKFLYNKSSELEWIDYNKNYLKMATHQLWILNNEPIPSCFTKEHLITPGSGFFWMTAAESPLVKEIDIVDISIIQIKFVTQLYENWDGIDYGKFVVDFMENNSVIHYNVDKNLTKLERLKFNNRDLLKKYINDNSPSINWDIIKTKKINIKNENIIPYILNNQNDSAICISNILDYKYTLLTSSYEEIESVQNILQKIS